MKRSMMLAVLMLMAGCTAETTDNEGIAEKSLTIGLESSERVVGSQMYVSASGTSSVDGLSIGLGSVAEWSSSDETVAVVSSNVVRFVGPGTATLTARYGAQTATVEVTTRAQPSTVRVTAR